MAGAYHANHGPWRPSTTQKVAYTGTAGVISNAVGSQTRVVRIYATSDAHIVFGVTPVATTDDMPVAAATSEYFLINPGEKVSAIQQSTGGDLYVTEMTR